MDFCSLKNSNKEKSSPCSFFLSIGHFSKENYVIARFSHPQGGKNQMVFFLH